MSMTVSIRVKPLKSRMVAGQVAHDLRPGVQPQYVDGQRTHLNTSSAPTRPTDLLAHALGKCKTKPRADWSPAWSCIITFGTKAQRVIERLPAADQDKIYSQISRRLADYLGVDLHYVTAHRDESAPHAHFMLCGISNSTGKSIRPKPQDMKKLQDLAGECCAHLSITRGTEKTVRIARGEDYSRTVNRSVKQLHNDLPREIQALEKTRDNLAALFKKLPQFPKPQAVEIIKKKRRLMPDITETQKVITPAQREEWFEHSKSRFAEYFHNRESEIESQRDKLIADRYAVNEKMRELEKVEAQLIKLSALLKRDLNIQNEMNHARNITDDALSIISPSPSR